jgi:hypothetical protein
MKITREVLEVHLDCKYKGHLKAAGEQGTRSDYEALLIEATDAVKRAATEKIQARCKDGEVARNIPLTTAALKAGPPFILDSLLEDAVLSLYFDGLTHSNGLKDVAACLGCSWTEPDASGIQSIVWRTR